MAAICKYYLKGKCVYGSRCHYLHSDPPRAEYNRPQVSYNDMYPRPSPNSPAGPLFPSQAQQLPRHFSPSTSHRPLFDSVENFSFKTGAQVQRGRPDLSKFSWKANKNGMQPVSVKVSFEQNDNARTFVHSPNSNRRIVQQEDTNIDANFWIKNIQNDMSVWKNSGMWMYSSYGCIPHKPSIFGFPDYSAEEVRLAAHQAHKEGLTEKYLHDLAVLSEQYRGMWHKIINLEPANRRLMENEVEALIKDSGMWTSSTQTLQFNRESLIRRLKVLIPPNLVQTHNHNANPSTFSFKISSPKETATATVLENKEACEREQIHNGLYSNVNDLSVEDLKAFSDNEFNLGQVPSVPPPIELC